MSVLVGIVVVVRPPRGGKHVLGCVGLTSHWRPEPVITGMGLTRALPEANLG